MKFVKYKPIQRSNGTILTPSVQNDPRKNYVNGIFSHPSFHGFHIGIATDGLNVNAFGIYEMADLTYAEALEMIHAVDPDATLDEDGNLTIPNLVEVLPES